MKRLVEQFLLRSEKVASGRTIFLKFVEYFQCILIVTLVNRLDYLEKREQRMFVHSVDFHFAEYVERRLEVIARPDVTNSIVKFFFIAWLLL